ncbi:hypothetical protein IW140_002832 [Coemansia sp. RSA 1813]|nr:hypothetical protein EV178_002752 [Coemansia sp. RSA 1646]KAJ1770110.1 hypothetical protein LPJ74_003471 [Coemansia sp. RSA 1843]KAJ2089851.1 hypothetical protein IW138_003145 [Coemansia sp. RSA 986]KAJ2214764.1 hypothetical protein EV179_002712 [Coemansia sp. RSA 487]KAJ2569751.1 hypothetical protein IW140_002832 [Coemansia sp. RSA 1813]
MVEQGASHSGWVRLLEEFFEKTELRQCLRTLKIETTTYPFIPSDAMLKDHLRCLSSGIQSLLEKIAREEPSDEVQSEGAGTKAIQQDIAQSVTSKEEAVRRIDAFIEVQRKEIDSNNRQEFLVSAEGRETTCARTDANGGNQGVKIHLDASQSNNSNSALERSVALHKSSPAEREAPPQNLSLGGLNERVENICDHLHVRFAPATENIYSRVAALEDRIMMLESEFPPWSAEHFHQPDRRYLQKPPITVYRVLPASPDTASFPSKFPHSSPDSINGKSVAAAGSQTAKPKTKTQSTPRPAPSLNKRRKTGTGTTWINSPLDKKGKPIFHSCGRGVNSSLTRAVLAQLQSRQQESQQQQPPSVAKPSHSPASGSS